MIIIGAGKIGTALARRSEAIGRPCALVRRTEGWEALDGPQGVPIVLAVRNDDLDGVLERVPGRRRDDLVFLQNGMLRPWLRDHGLGQATRGLIYFAVRSVGAPIEPGYPAPFCGSHAPACVSWFRAMGLDAEVVNWLKFSTREVEKILWLVTMGLLCQAHGLTVGEVCTQHRSELEALLAELCEVVAAATGVEFPLDYLTDRICGYSATLADYTASFKEWPWRSGWLEAEARRASIPTPLHQGLVRAIGQGALLDL